MKSYTVKHIETGNIQVNGKGNSPFWNEANVLTDFCSPWDDKKIKRIEFRALNDNDNLFFCFKVEDSEVHINSAKDRIVSIDNSDRVELFFRSDANLNPYYCFEIDPTPRIMDFKALPNKQFDFNSNWPKDDIEVKSTIKETFFIVEGKISLKSLTHYGLLKEGQIETGIYRAKYNKQDDGSYEPIWITWVNPNTETPNFHIASSFGVLKLENC